jgi:hypothetical protein
MPIPGARYRVKTYPSGKKVRLAFKGNEVVETKDLGTGKLHTIVASHIRKRKTKRRSR